MSLPEVVSDAEWIEARNALLAEEKALTRTEQLGGSYAFLDRTALGSQEEREEPKGRAEAARANVPDFST